MSVFLPNRRDLLSSASRGLLGAAAWTVLNDDVAQAAEPFNLSPKPAHFAPRAKSVIQLFMNGGPSQMDLFDPKPDLDKHHGRAHFEKIAGEVENPQVAGALMRSPYKFAQHGECGAWVSDAMPHLAACVDDIAFVRSMHAPNLTHEPALYKIHSGSTLPGLPTMGAWVSYALGSENENLPAYVVLDDPRGLPINRTFNWQAGFLPPSCQGTRFRSEGSPILNLRPNTDQPDLATKLERKLRQTLDRQHELQHPHEPRLAARIASYQLAARMQLTASDALDLKQESAQTRTMYGLDNKITESYGRRCLYARRLVERGVRFVQLFIDGQVWDNHTALKKDLKAACERTDQPIAALLRDLKQRGLLDTTLVVWGGEFGRLPIAQLPGDKNAANAGRDHNKNAMITWLAGGGVKGGVTFGATDELGFAAVENRVSIADWHATILHQLGIDHRQLFVNRRGLEERLTGVEEAHVIQEILSNKTTG